MSNVNETNDTFGKAWSGRVLMKYFVHLAVYPIRCSFNNVRYMYSKFQHVIYKPPSFHVPNY